MRLRIEVDRDRVRALADGKSIVDWSGDLSRLSLNGGYYPLPDPRMLALAANNSEYRVFEARILPLNAPSPSLPDKDAVTQAIDQVREKLAGEMGAAKRADQKTALARSLREEAERAGI